MPGKVYMKRIQESMQQISRLHLVIQRQNSLLEKFLFFAWKAHIPSFLHSNITQCDNVLNPLPSNEATFFFLDPTLPRPLYYAKQHGLETVGALAERATQSSDNQNLVSSRKGLLRVAATTRVSQSSAGSANICRCTCTCERAL